MTALLTPYDKGNAKPAGRNLFRKQLLPIAKIDYKGRVLNFTKDYLASLVKAFNDRAYDMVPFQLAPHGNEHTNDPERTRGEIAALELTDSGLDVIVSASDAGAKVLRDNPKLGVSARIVEDYARSDGRVFPAALQHVLGTLDPRIPGMRPWEAVEAANDGGDVLDFTAAEYASPQAPPAEPPKPAQPAPANPGTPATEEHAMALTPEQEARLGKLLDLPAEQFDALITPPAEPAGAEDESEEGELSDAELADLLATLDESEPEAEGAETEPEKETAGATLSAEAQAAIDLANARAEETEMALKRVTTKLAAAAYEAERDTLARVHGIPPRITDLARPLLEGEGRVVELSNGKHADAGEIVRRVLQEVGKTVKMLDLTAELGTSLDGSAEAAQAAEEATTEARQQMVSRVRQLTGI